MNRSRTASTTGSRRRRRRPAGRRPSGARIVAGLIVLALLAGPGEELTPIAYHDVVSSAELGDLSGIPAPFAGGIPLPHPPSTAAWSSPPPRTADPAPAPWDRTIHAAVLPASRGGADSSVNGSTRGAAAGGPVYPVDFNESGLPSGENWSVAVNGTTVEGSAASFEFLETNGSHPFAIGAPSGTEAAPAQGTVNVTGGPAAVEVTFAPSRLRPVLFAETGLPNGTFWSVTLNGTRAFSLNGSISFAEPNGTYAFAVGSVAGFDPQRSSGLVTVGGNGATVLVRFASTASSPPFDVVAFALSPSDVAQGGTLAVSVAVSGGSGNLTFVYSGLPPGCSAPDRDGWSCVPASAGSFAVTVEVFDSIGDSTNASARLTVRAAPVPALGLLPYEGPLLAAGAFLGILALVGVVRSRRNPAAQGKTPAGPPSGSPGPKGEKREEPHRPSLRTRAPEGRQPGGPSSR